MAIESATTATVTAASAANARNLRSLFDRVLFARVAFEEDSIAAGASSAAVYTLVGVQQGDFVLVSAVSDLGDDIIFTGQATAADEVTVVATDASAATNVSAATVGNLNIVVLGVSDNAFVGAAGA